MNEMKLLEDFRAAVAPPDEELLARTRARVLGGGQDGRRARGRRLPGSRPRLALTGVAAAATAAAVTVALATQGGGPERSATASSAVKELAYRVAAVAATRPNVRPGQWVYWQEKTVTAPGKAAGPAGHETFQVWTTADSGKAAYLSKGKVVLMSFPPCLHGAGCQSIGQPVPATLPDGQGQVVTGVAGKIPVSYTGLRSLPRSPVALDRYLAGLPLRGWGPAPVREFEVIKELLTTYVMPPALTAELYRALGNIPGVTVDRDAVDAAGRRGIGFQITLPRAAGGEIDQLVLDPKTYSLMGQQLILAPSAGSAAGRVLSGTAILSTALVSGPGVLP
jgi:hypothetical protein